MTKVDRRSPTARPRSNNVPSTRPVANSVASSKRMGAAADRLWTCGQRKRVAHRVHSSQQQTQKIATASIRSKETRIPPAVRSHAVPNCQRNAHRFFRGGNLFGGGNLGTYLARNGTDH